ncbi:glycine zipper 2TM domain-containing protein [Derxia lacustris]|uniref:glycine zipper 2TM domain-containing protein n=1 Tax=Derxia lacustris TaxID=764842 RepID=UPI000A172C7D|nr:glycine zipper 2TM domain-containing protein [Derxia lacustris]
MSRFPFPRLPVLAAGLATLAGIAFAPLAQAHGYDDEVRVYRGERVVVVDDDRRDWHERREHRGRHWRDDCDDDVVVVRRAPRVIYEEVPVVRERIVYREVPVYRAAPPAPVYREQTGYYGGGPNLGTVTGAIAGAAIGSQIGGGNGRTAAIAIGSVLGAAVGTGVRY